MSSHKKGVLKGTKFNGRHSTFIDPAGTVIEAAKRLDCVSKVILGPIENTGSGGSHLRIRPQPSGALKVIVTGGGAAQTLYVYTTEQHLTESVLKEAWEKK